MPYTTVVPSTTITAAWGNANVRDQVVTPFASAAARTSAVTSPADMMVTGLQDLPRRFEFWDSTAAAYRPIGATIECTAATKANLTARDGLRIYETDTGVYRRGNGSKFLLEKRRITLTSNFSWTSDATPSSDPLVTQPAGGLVVPVEAGGRYVWRCVFHVMAITNIGMTIQLNQPAGATSQIAQLGVTTAGAITIQRVEVSATTDAWTFGSGNGTVGQMVMFEGQTTAGGTAGNIAFNFSQGVSGPNTATLMSGTTLEIEQIA